MPTPNVFVCVGCDKYAISDRTDALTCSPACRVRAHRNGELKRLRKEAYNDGVPPGMYVRALAIMRLRPDLIPRLMKDRHYTYDDARDEVWQAFVAHLKAHGVF